MFPILIRTRNRPEYLHITLKSLTATDLLGGQIIINDDCSDDELTKKYLYSSEKINLPILNWKDQIFNNGLKQYDIDVFKKYFYDLPIINEDVRCLKNKFSIISPEFKMGDKNGLLWSILIGFSFYPNSEYIIVIEDDLIFNKDWLKIANKIYYETLQNNEYGIISVYNRIFKDVNNDQLFLKVDNIGGVMYLIPNVIFQEMNKKGFFNQKFDNKHNSSGDVYFYEFVLKNKYNIFNSTTSYIQHIGVKSICREGRFLRYSKNFLKPYAWNDDFDK